MSEITCCKGCEKRHQGCHSKCNNYIEQKAKLEVVRENDKKWRESHKVPFFLLYEINIFALY